MLFKQNIGGREFYQFPHLAELEIFDDDLLAYCEHLEKLKVDMIKRFGDLLELELSHWLIDPFFVDATTISICKKSCLISLREVLVHSFNCKRSKETGSILLNIEF